jgi:preprotein translocase subunit YajC
MLPLLLQDAPAAGGIFGMLPLLLGMLAIFWFVAIWPERKARKKKEAMLSAVRKNDKVLLTSGIYATVAAVNEDELTVRFDDSSTRARVLRSAIAQVLTPASAEAGKEPAGS